MDISYKALAVAIIAALGVAFSLPASAGSGGLPETAQACYNSTPMLQNPNCGVYQESNSVQQQSVSVQQQSDSVQQQSVSVKNENKKKNK